MLPVAGQIRQRVEAWIRQADCLPKTDLFDVAALGLATLLPSGAASRALIVSVLINPVDTIRTGALLGIEGTTAYVVGDTRSLDFPLVGGQLAGETDAFVAAFNATGTGVNYIKLHGGSDIGYGNGIDVEAGYAYITGSTYSNDIPGGPVKKLDGFAVKYNPTGERIYASIFGGRNYDGAYDIVVSGGNAFIAGEVRKGDQILKLRDDATGRPLWAKGRGRNFS